MSKGSFSQKPSQAKTIRPRDITPMDDHVSNDPKAIIESEYYVSRKSLADEVARSGIYVRNWKYPGSDLAFPYEPKLRTVDKYYPYAKCGPLMVDEPLNEYDMADAVKKLSKLKSMGQKFIILKPDADMHSAMQQLSEFEIK